MTKIVIKAAGVSIEAELLQTPTADAIYNALPVMGSANVFGRVEGDASVFKTVADGTAIRVEKA